MPITRSVIFTPAARLELIEAQDWYESELAGLGRRFLTQVETVVGRMREDPQQFPVIYNNVRRALLRHFPYALLFVVEPDEALTVIACFHGSRDPRSWRQRA